MRFFSFSVFLKNPNYQPHKKYTQNGTRKINKHVTQQRTSFGNERLMRFVQHRAQKGTHHRQQCAPRQRTAAHTCPCIKKQHTKHGKFRHMCAFANDKTPRLEQIFLYDLFQRFPIGRDMFHDPHRNTAAESPRFFPRLRRKERDHNKPQKNECPSPPILFHIYNSSSSKEWRCPLRNSAIDHYETYSSAKYLIVRTIWLV